MNDPGEHDDRAQTRSEVNKGRTLREDMEAHPERYPGGTWREPQKGRSWLIFLGRSPTKAPKKQS